MAGRCRTGPCRMAWSCRWGWMAPPNRSVRRGAALAVALVILGACGGGDPTTAADGDGPSIGPVATVGTPQPDGMEPPADQGDSGGSGDPQSDPPMVDEPPPELPVDERTGPASFLLSEADMPGYETGSTTAYEVATEPVESGCAPMDALVAGEAAGLQRRFVNDDQVEVQSIAQHHATAGAAAALVAVVETIGSECDEFTIDGTAVTIQPMAIVGAPQASAGLRLGLTDADLDVAIGAFQANDVMVLLQVQPAQSFDRVAQAQIDRLEIGLEAASNPSEQQRLERALVRSADFGPDWDREGVEDRFGGEGDPGPCNTTAPPEMSGLFASYSRGDGAEAGHLVSTADDAAVRAWFTLFEKLLACEEAEADGLTTTASVVDVTPPADVDAQLIVAVAVTAPDGEELSSFVFVLARSGDLFSVINGSDWGEAVEATAETLVALTDLTFARWVG